MALPRSILCVITGTALLLGVQACTKPAAQVDMKRLLNADAEPGQWMTHSRTFDEQYFSPLDKINEGNIGKLGLAWYVDFPTNQNVETTPLMVDGVLYVTLPWSMVMAVDAKSGKQLWLYDPRVDKAWNGNICCGVDNRGAAAWNGKIIFGTLDGRLIALDAKSGKQVWSVKATPDERRYSITSAPRIANGKLFIGSAGAEFDVRGYLDAYDVETGKRLWRFWTIPGDPAKGFENDAMKMAAETWKTPGWWEEGKGGGGSVWDAITYDPTTDLVIFGTGNGAPWDAVQRDPGRGDNLFVTSIVAVHAEDGSYAWHYQPNPWETWDYDNVQQLMLLDVEIDGQQRHTVMQAAKNGMFYVLDAKTGELLSAKAYTDVNWNTGVDMATGRPIEVPEARPNLTNKPFNLVAGPAGGHAWQSMSYSPITKLVYIPATTHWQLNGPFELRAKYLAEHPDAKQTFSGRLTAWDPIAQKEVWRSEEFLNPTGGVQVTAGALATAGNVVFHGNLPKKEFAAYRATDGERLWSFDTKTAVLDNPISYELGDEQYVAIAVGGPVAGGYYAPNGARLLVFKLGGTAVLPELPEFTQAPIAPPPQFADAETVSKGAQVFEAQCQLCHGRNGAARSTFPDLRRSPALQSQELMDAIVLQGTLSQRGMASFKQYLQDGDTVALRAYLISAAEAALAAPQGRGAGPGAGPGPGRESPDPTPGRARRRAEVRQARRSDGHGMTSLRIGFLGAAGTVTGSRYLVELGERRLLVDCGLFQGYKLLRLRNWAPPPFDPSSIQAVILTHAHIDHSGYLPRLVRQGFRGPVYCSRATLELCRLLLPDSGSLHEEDARYANAKGFSRHHPALPLYTRADAEESLQQFQAVSSNTEFEPLPGLRAELRNAGHILGANFVRLATAGTSITFSGDLGRTDDALMNPPEAPAPTDYLVVESTYGDRKHPDIDAEAELGGWLRQCIARGGVAVIPGFAVGRVQSLLWHIAELKRRNLLPDVPVYVDSPMATDATSIYGTFRRAHRLDAQQTRRMCAAATFTNSADQSKLLDQRSGPMVIISASGMATGGRVLHHLKAFAGDARNLILFAGFQAPGTRGAALVGGARRVRIHGREFAVNAEVAQLEAASSHADADGILAWMRQLPAPPRHVYVTHGEPVAADTLRARIEHELGWTASTPEYREFVEIGAA